MNTWTGHLCYCVVLGVEVWSFSRKYVACNNELQGDRHVRGLYSFGIYFIHLCKLAWCVTAYSALLYAKEQVVCTFHDGIFVLHRKAIVQEWRWSKELNWTSYLKQRVAAILMHLSLGTLEALACMQEEVLFWSTASFPLPGRLKVSFGIDFTVW